MAVSVSISMFSRTFSLAVSSIGSAFTRDADLETLFDVVAGAIASYELVVGFNMYIISVSRLITKRS